MHIQTKFGLTGNQLKLIAMVTMTLDHIGVVLLPQWKILRCIGRLAMPIYAYMLAEGCYYTHNRKGYLLRIAALALLCQVVYWFFDASLYQCILVMFSMSIALISAVEYAKKEPSAVWLPIAVLGGIYVVCQWFPKWIPTFEVDYGFYGVLLPVIVYLSGRSIYALLAGLLLLCSSIGNISWWSLGAVPLLALYNGQRGKAKLGWVFYLYYPIHLAVIQGIALLFA